MRPTNSRTPNSNSEIIELTIDSLSYNGGRGVGRFEGVVVFVPLTAPGDRIRARVTHKKARLWEAELVEILQPSPSRREAPCPVFGRCGGCAWQHISYETQVEQKEKILRSSMRGVEKLGAVEWRPFLAAPEEFNYRNRIQVQVRGRDYGFFGKRSHDLVSVRECWIAEKPLNEQLKNLNPGDARKIEIARLLDGKTQVMVGERDPEAALFSQVNEAQNEALKRTLLNALDFTPDWLMDLYAGSGNLTVPLSGKFPGVRLHAVELSRAAVERAPRMQGVVWEAGDVGQVLARLKPSHGSGAIVLDPPRTGVSRQVVDELIRHRPKRIVYVSCNPSTLARDLESLVKSGRYHVETVQGLDMFPQTEHVEVVATLRNAT